MAINTNSFMDGRIAVEDPQNFATKIVSNDIAYNITQKNLCDSLKQMTPSQILKFQETVNEQAEKARQAQEAWELRGRQLVNSEARAMVKRVIFSGRVTTIIWNDGTKTSVTRQKGEKKDKEKAILACMAKKLFKNTPIFNDVVREWCYNE